MGGWALWDTAPTHAGMGGHGQILALEHFPGHPVFPADVSLGYSLPINSDKNTEPVLEKGGGSCAILLGNGSRGYFRT